MDFCWHIFFSIYAKLLTILNELWKTHVLLSLESISFYLKIIALIELITSFKIFKKIFLTDLKALYVKRILMVFK